MLIDLEDLMFRALDEKWETLQEEYNGPLQVIERSYDEEYAGLIVKHETYPEFALSFATHVGGRIPTDSILAYVDTDCTLDIIDEDRYYEELCRFVTNYREDIEEVGGLLNMATDRIKVL